MSSDRKPVVDPIRRRKRRRIRFIVYGSLIALLWGFWVWQPWELDVIRRKPPKPNPAVDPDSDRLFARGTKIAVVVGHPDDAEFYIGGSLTRLGATADITLICVTDGDKAYYPFEDWQSNRRVRRQEQTDATRKWKGRNVVFLAYPDGRLRVTKELELDLTRQLESLKPDYIMTFDGEFPPRFSHQDHRRTGDAVANVLDRRPDLCRWLMRFSTIAANHFIDITDQWDAKRALLAVHKSQFHGERLERVTNMVQDRAVEDGERIGVTYAEGFRCIEVSPWGSDGL